MNLFVKRNHREKWFKYINGHISVDALVKGWILSTTGSENRSGLALVRTTCDKSLKLMTSLQEIVLISTSEHQEHSCVIFLAMV